MKSRIVVSVLVLLSLLLPLPLTVLAQEQVSTVFLPMVASSGSSGEMASAEMFSADQGPGVQPHPFAGDRLVRVMTHNLYFGVDLAPLLTETDPTKFAQVATELYEKLMATDMPGRMEAIANEIATTQPMLVGLQEAAIWSAVSADPTAPVLFEADFVQMLLAALASRGLYYEAIVVAPGVDAEVPTLFGFNVHLTLQDAILARADLKTADLKLSNLQTGHYATKLVIENPVIGSFSFPRQWASVDVKIRGKEFRFITTHLEAYSPLVRVGQASELLNGPANTALPLIVAGDFNSQPDVGSDAAALLLAGGLRDLWQQSYPADTGFTCCQLPTLDNAESQLSERIDIIFARGDWTVLDMQRVGSSPTDKTASGLWPSDHAGVLATVQLP